MDFKSLIYSLQNWKEPDNYFVDAFNQVVEGSYDNSMYECVYETMDDILKQSKDIHYFLLNDLARIIIVFIFTEEVNIRDWKVIEQFIRQSQIELDDLKKNDWPVEGNLEEIAKAETEDYRNMMKYFTDKLVTIHHMHEMFFQDYDKKEDDKEIEPNIDELSLFGELH